MIVSYIIFFVFRHFKRKKTLSRNRQIAFLCRVKYLRKITGVNKREKGCRYKQKKKTDRKKGTRRRIQMRTSRNMFDELWDISCKYVCCIRSRRALTAAQSNRTTYYMKTGLHSTAAPCTFASLRYRSENSRWIARAISPKIKERTVKRQNAD